MCAGAGLEVADGLKCSESAACGCPSDSVFAAAPDVAKESHS